MLGPHRLRTLPNEMVVPSDRANLREVLQPVSVWRLLISRRKLQTVRNGRGRPLGGPPRMWREEVLLYLFFFLAIHRFLVIHRFLGR
jgi:hypothetical protein